MMLFFGLMYYLLTYLSVIIFVMHEIKKKRILQQLMVVVLVRIFLAMKTEEVLVGQVDDSNWMNSVYSTE